MKLRLFSFLLLFCASGVYAQRDFYKSLENVRLENKTLYYENRVQRNQSLVFLSAAKEYSYVDQFVPLIQGRPVAQYNLDSTGEIHVLPKVGRLSNPNKFFKRYKYEIIIAPQFSVYFGNLAKSIESKTNVLLQTQLILPAGLALNTGLTIPIINDLDDQPLNLRLAPTFLNQFIPMPNYHYVSWSVGSFYQDRYGVDVQYQHADPESPWSYGIEGAYTGVYYWYPQNLLRYTKLNDVMVLANVNYRFYKTNTLLKLSGGQFLYNDRGARIELMRQFTKADIGLFGVMSGNGATVGVHLAFGIPPGPILEGERTRIRTTEEFRWEYTYARGYSIGERFRVGYRLEERLALYHKNYWKLAQQRSTNK